MSVEHQEGVETKLPPVIALYAKAEAERLQKSPIFRGINVPHGDGQHVVVIPGLSESDSDMCFLIEFLSNIGYVPETSGMGFNLGWPHQHELSRRKVIELIRRFGKVSIIGHSIGGRSAAQIAETEQGVDKVIALGSPYLSGINTAGNALFESIYSPNDGLVNNFMSQFRGPHSKNVEVLDPNHFELLCNTTTFNEIGIALAS